MFSLEEPEEAGALTVVTVMLTIDVGADPSYNVAVSMGEEKLYLGVLEEGVVSGRKSSVLEPN